MASIDSEHVDVVIVGARLAGSSAAVALARAGKHVVVLDKGSFPSDQMSTHMMAPSGVAELQTMGALSEILSLKPTLSRELNLEVDDFVVTEKWAPVDTIDYCLVVPRPLQDQALVNAARAAGADVRERSPVHEVLKRGDRVLGVSYRDPAGENHTIYAPLVIGADGRGSVVASAVGSWEPYRGSKNQRAFVFRYMDDPAFGTRLGSSIGVFRNGNDGRDTGLAFPSCPEGRLLAILMIPVQELKHFRKDPEGAWARRLADNPGFAERIGPGINQDKLRMTDKLSSYYRASSGPGWALAGDAGTFKDPVIGQGQRDALRHGRLLGEAVSKVLDDPVALDAALHQWEVERDADTLSSYHWGNQDTRAEPISPLVVEVMRSFVGDGTPNLSDMLNRARKPDQIVGLGRLFSSAIRAARRSDSSASAVGRELVGALKEGVAIGRETRKAAFRYAGPSASENEGWAIGPAPRITVRQLNDDSAALAADAMAGGAS